MNQSVDRKTVLSRGQANIEANRQGKLTAQQKDGLQDDLKQARRQAWKQVYLSAMVLLVVIVVILLMPYLPITIVVPILLWLGGVGVWYAYSWWTQKPIREDITDGTVVPITGYIDKSTTHGYHVTVQQVDYATPPKLYDAFDETERYTLYVTPRSKIVVSAEILED